MITFRNKKFNIVFSIVSVVMILFTILVPCFSVHAADYYVENEAGFFGDNYNILPTFFTVDDFDLDYVPILDDTSSYSSLFESLLEQNFPFAAYEWQANYFPNGNYFISTNGSGLSFKQATEGSFVVFYNTEYNLNYTPHYQVYLKIDDTVQYMMSNNRYFRSYNYNSNGSAGNGGGTQLNNNMTRYSVDGFDYLVLSGYSGSNGSGGSMFSSDMPVYFVENWSAETFNSLNGLDNLNILTGSGGVSKADIENKAILKKGSKIFMSNNSFNVGDFYIYPTLTEDQTNHPTNYSLRLVGNCVYGIQYNSDANIKVTARGSNLASLYPFTDNTINSVRGTLSSSESSSYMDIPFSLLLDGSYHMTLDQLNAHFSVSGRDGGIQELASGLDQTYGGVNFWQGLFRVFNGTSVSGAQFNFGDAYEAAKYDCLPHSAIYNIEVFVVSNGSVSSRPMLVCNFDLCSGQVTEVVDNTVSDDDIISSLDSGVLPQGYGTSIYPPSNLPGTVSSNSSSGGSGGNANSNNNIESGAIVINNNPTFNNNTSSSSESGLGSGGLIGFITGIIIGNKKSSTDSMEDMVNTGGWFGVINQVYGFVPGQVWTLIFGAFTAAIGIVIVAFIISIVIKFVT